MSLDVEELIAHDVGSAISPAEVPDILEAITQRIVANAAIAAVGAEVVGDAEIAGAVAAVAGGIGLFPIILIALGLVVTIGFLDNTLATMASRIPWVGGPLARFIHLVFDPIHSLETWTTNRVGDLVHGLWNDLTHVIGYFADRHTVQHASTSQIPTNAQVKTLQAEINDTNARLNQVNQRIDQLNAFVHNNPAPTLPQGVLTLPEQLYKVEQDIQVLYHNQSQFHTELQTVVAELQRLVHDMQQIEQSLIGTRTIEVGFQDLSKQFSDLVAQTQALEAYFGAKVSENTRSIGELQPLNLLLEPGLPGLRNLRKLEDDPCQCPKLGKIGNELGTALALLEFVENG